MKQPYLSRRQFLKGSAVVAGALAIPTIIPASALGRQGTVAPSERITVGCIGVGGKGRHNMGVLASYPDCEVVAICDVDQRMIDQTPHEGMAVYRDYRDLLTRDDIDAVCISTPDHWHALASVHAAEAGKDVYCEKPLANSIGEGRLIVEAVKRNNVVFQVGSHERSTESIRFACELVRNGRLGKVHRIQIHLPCTDGHHIEVKNWKGIPDPMPVPDGFDYDQWLGHTPWVPYTERRCHFWWRFILAYGGGEMTDRGAHVIDIAQLGAGLDNTGPTHIDCKGTRPEGSLYDTFMDYSFVNRYDNGLELIGSTDEPRGLRFEGTEGSLFVHIHGGALEADPPSLLEEQVGDNEVRLGRSPGHHRNFLDCIRTREETMAPVEAGHRTATICHLNNISMLVGRPLMWDPVTERILGDDEAQALLMPSLRRPYTFD